MHGVTKGDAKVWPSCVELEYKGTTWECVLDSGAECSMVPPDMLVDEEVRAVGDTLYSINGQQLKVVGGTEIVLKAGRKVLKTRALVVSGIERPNLGLEWLRQHKVLWEFETDTVMLDGFEIPLVRREVAVESDATQPVQGTEPRVQQQLQQQQRQDRQQYAVRRITSSSSSVEQGQRQQQQRGEAERDEQCTINAQSSANGSERRRGNRGRRSKRPEKQVCYRCRMVGHRVSQCPDDPKGQPAAQVMGRPGTARIDEQAPSACVDVVERTDQGGHRRGCSGRDAVERKDCGSPDHQFAAPPFFPSPPSHPNPSPAAPLSSSVWSETRADATGRGCGEHRRWCESVDATWILDMCQ